MNPSSLGEFVSRLRTGPIHLLPEGEEWSALIERITKPGSVEEVSEETYDYFLDVLPPRWMGGGIFAFGEGADHIRLFWRGTDKLYFARQLSEEENRLFCKLAKIPLTSG